VKLWSYWRSSCSYRVRIALALKGLSAEQIPVHLVAGGGEQHTTSYRQVNPQGLVPSLDLGTGQPALSQSLAIVEYLEEKYPSPALLPHDPYQRATVRSFALSIVAEVQPLQNLRVLQFLEKELQQDKSERDAFAKHWMALGFASLEKRLKGDSPFCFGATPGLAEVVLVPQLYNARRFGVDLQPFPKLLAVDSHCQQLPAFAQAAPETQPDAA
jgi:maleylacetoacetate isomerase